MTISGWVTTSKHLGQVTGQEFTASLVSVVEHMEEVSEDFRPENFVEFDDIVTVSAKRRQNIDELKQQFRRLLDIHADMQRNVDAFVDRRWGALQRYSAEHYGQHLV